jgi:hypothetical protein
MRTTEAVGFETCTIFVGVSAVWAGYYVSMIRPAIWTVE